MLIEPEGVGEVALEQAAFGGVVVAFADLFAALGVGGGDEFVGGEVAGEAGEDQAEPAAVDGALAGGVETGAGIFAQAVGVGGAAGVFERADLIVHDQVLPGVGIRDDAAKFAHGAIGFDGLLELPGDPEGSGLFVEHPAVGAAVDTGGVVVSLEGLPILAATQVKCGELFEEVGIVRVLLT